MRQLQIHPDDNVVVNVGGEYNGHKTAIRDIKAGENIIKYGYPIGHAICDIKKGEHVHTHNIKTNLSGILEYKYEPQLKGETKAEDKMYFDGFVREDGSVGIRNEIWIVNTVGCINMTSKKLAEEANKLYAGRTDGIFNFVHPFGCSQLGEDQATTQHILKGLVNHPNAAEFWSSVWAARITIFRCLKKFWAIIIPIESNSCPLRSTITRSTKV